MSETSTGPPKVFISYRRSESGGHAGRLYDAMGARFGEGNVFMDVALQPGVDFVERITAAVSACHVLLVVMGPDWARAAPGAARPRIADPDDFVRLEVATALRRTDVTVIPVLVEDAEMPDPDELPADLRALTRRNAVELCDVRWRSDVARLLGVMETLLEDTPHVTPAAPAPGPSAAATPAARAGRATNPLAGLPGRLRRRSVLVLVAVAVAVAGGLGYVIASGSEPGGEDPVKAQVSTGSGAASSARPAEVPRDCVDRGKTEFSSAMSAERDWGCEMRTTKDVFGASLTYLEYANAARAHSEFASTLDYELDNGWEVCNKRGLERSGAADAYCVVATAGNADEIEAGTIEILWRAEGSRVLGHTTFDPPTTVSNAIAEWSRHA